MQSVSPLSDGIDCVNETFIQAFPSVSTGVYGYPMKDATNIAINEVRQFLDSESGTRVSSFVYVACLYHFL